MKGDGQYGRPLPEELIMTIMMCADVTVTRAVCPAGCAVDPALHAHHDPVERLVSLAG